MKRLLCIILAVILVSGCFFGCSKKDNSEEEKNENTLSINFNYDSTYSNTDQSAVNAYEAMCKGVLEYSSEIRMNTGLLDAAQQLFYTSFPLSVLVKDIKINSDSSGIELTYTKDETEHKKSVVAFKAKVEEIKEKCFENTTNTNVYAIRLYNYISSSIVLSDDSTVNCLDTFLSGKGTSFTYSQMFEYMLRQGDVPSFHVLAADAAGQGWGIAGAELDGEIYYFDLMTEFYDNKGTNLKYFGMTTEDLSNEGLKNLVLTNQTNAQDASDLRFDVLRRSESWKLDGAKLLVTLKSSDIVEVAL